MGSLSARLKAQEWLQDWPLQAVEDFDSSPKTLPPDMGYPRMQKVCQAAFRQADSVVTVQEIHGLLDRLDAWNDRHASALTWPATLEGFIKAISRDIETKHDDVTLMKILVPGMVDLALAPRAAAPVQEKNPKRDLPAPTVSSSSVPDPQPSSSPAPSSPPATSREVKPSTEPSSGARRPSASPELALKLLEVVNTNPGGIASEKIDATIKSLVSDQAAEDPTRTSTARFKFFVKDLMPSIAMLDPAGIDTLMECWPANASVDIARPEAVLARTDFWVAMKAGGPESRVAVMSKVLPRLFHGQTWSPEQSLEALQQIMARVRSPDEFSRRLDLWHAWGGNLDSPIIKPDENSADDFSTAVSGPTTARSWIEDNMSAHKDQLPPSRRNPRGP